MKQIGVKKGFLSIFIENYENFELAQKASLLIEKGLRLINLPKKIIYELLIGPYVNSKSDLMEDQERLVKINPENSFYSRLFLLVCFI